MNKTFSSNISVLPANKNFNNIYESGTLVHKILSDNSILSENELNFKMISDISGLYYTNNSIDGKSIELLTETECQVYLKQCIETEDYEKAELIKERLKNFR